MQHRLIVQLFNRAEIDKSDSDFAYFFALLLAAEAMAKTVILGMLAALDEDTESNRYRLLHKLVRSNGLGDWSDVIQDALSGPASQFLEPDAHNERNQLTKRCSKDEWQYEAVASLKKAMDVLSIDAEPVPNRTNMMRWFRLFATLRNKTRGHGATRPANCGEAAEHLLRSIHTIYRNFHLFERQWVFLYRNLSGKYRVTRLTDESSHFDYLRTESTHSLSNGVYIHFGSHKLVPLFSSDPDLNDFFLPNGGFSEKSFELLSYITDDRKAEESSPYLNHPHSRESETLGFGELIARGKTFSNSPEPAKDYVARPELEDDLFDLLMDDRRPAVTLQGAGGVGKTSTALKVIDRISQETRFEMIVWFSARDIDLLPYGPRTVRPGILTHQDVADQYARFVLSPGDLQSKNVDRVAYFQEQLGDSDGGKCLYVFDNFETVQNPSEMFTWIENFIRVPNKVLITTRLRDFKGDYPLEVRGMTEQEARSLVDLTIRRLNIRHLLTSENINEIIATSGGHPYVIKILLGEVANKKRFSSSRQVVASSGEILTALFERTFNALSPCGQRAFMTLAAWNSAVPRVALEAVLISSTSERLEVENGIEALLHYSLAEEWFAEPDRQEFISLPLAAQTFGKQKLQISFQRPAIESDVQTLRMFGTSSSDNMSMNLGRGLRNFIRSLSDRIDVGEPFANYEPILDMVCRAYNLGWLQLAEWRLERGEDEDLDYAVLNIQAFLQGDQNSPNAADAWHLLASVYRKKEHTLGEVHAFVERSQFPSVPYFDLSSTANLFNSKYGELEFDDGKIQLAQRLLDVMEARSGEANPNDYSRMAWLAMYVSRHDKAKDFTERGLEIDPENIHCQRIASRLANEM